jgi:hypothetical protein
MAGYGSDEEFTTWLEANGYVLPVGAPTPTVLRQRGSSYIDGRYGYRFSGSPTGGLSQDRAWPRTGATDIYGNSIPTDLIPNQVIEASYYAAWFEANSPGSLAIITNPSGMVKRQKVDTIEREFFDPSKDPYAVLGPTSSMIEGLLAPLLDLPAGSGFGIAVV